MGFSALFGLLAGIIAVIAYGFYLKQIRKNQSTPNPTSWAIWSLVGIINVFTYFSVTQGNIYQTLIVIVVLLSNLTIFLYSLVFGKFIRISIVETIVFILAVCIGIFWQTAHNARIANLLLQGIYLLSYVPVIISVATKRARENPTSWLIAIVAYVFSALSIGLGAHADWIAYLNPLVNGLLGTGVTVLVILYKNRYRLV